MAASYRDNEPWPRADEAIEMEDGSIVLQADDGRWYREGPDGRPDMGRPVEGL